MQLMSMMCFVVDYGWGFDFLPLIWYRDQLKYYTLYVLVLSAFCPSFPPFRLCSLFPFFLSPISTSPLHSFSYPFLNLSHPTSFPSSLSLPLSPILPISHTLYLPSPPPSCFLYLSLLFHHSHSPSLFLHLFLSSKLFPYLSLLHLLHFVIVFSSCLLILTS